jgi:hypothetical protein
VLRWDVLAAIPTTSTRLIELRRRLAIVCVFEDPLRGRSSPEKIFSIRAVIDRMDDDDFVIDPQTEYYELLAITLILNITIDDGGPPAISDGPEVVKSFNGDVDELAAKIRHKWSQIRMGQFVSRIEARSALQDLERKLLYTVRTRPPPKNNAFGIESDQKENVRPRQQEFMKKFFKKEDTGA